MEPELGDQAQQEPAAPGSGIPIAEGLRGDEATGEHRAQRLGVVGLDVPRFWIRRDQPIPTDQDDWPLDQFLVYRSVLFSPWHDAGRAIRTVIAVLEIQVAGVPIERRLKGGANPSAFVLRPIADARLRRDSSSGQFTERDGSKSRGRRACQLRLDAGPSYDSDVINQRT